jgi:hypothetical protein
MVAIMIGSSLFKICIMKLGVAPEALAKYIFGIAAVSLFIPTTTTVCNFLIFYFFNFLNIIITSANILFLEQGFNIN